MGAWKSRVAACCLLLAGALVLGSCDSAQQRALRELSRLGVEASGHSLVQAVLRHDVAQTGWLLDAGVHTEQRDAQGRTPLRIAVDDRDLLAALRLIEARANVNATTADDVSVLGIAAVWGEPLVVAKLLTAGARADGRMPDGETILPWAIRQGRLVLVRMMMRAGADPHLKDRQGNPLLHVAMDCGRRELVDALITLGADPGAVDAAGESTLHFALRRGWLDAVPRLIAGGADPNLPSPGGTTPLEQAISARDAGLLGLLLRCGADPNLPGPAGFMPLERVVAARATGLLDVLLRSGADPNRAGAAGTTAVHAAIAGRWPEGMRLLARAKADFSRPDAAGTTPLETAFAANDRELLGWLLSVGVDPAWRSARGNLLVEEAAAAGRGSLAKLLLDYGSPAGNALLVACTRGDSGMAGLLLGCGVAPNACRAPTFDSPLAAALRARDDALAASLIVHGAATNTRLAEGQSPLHLAVATGCHRTVKCLLDAGANPNTPCSHPVSPAFIRQVRPGIMQWELRMDRNLTPLMLAADAGVPQSAIHLIAAGAKKSACTRLSRFGPLNFAAQREDVKMMRALLGQDPEREERRIVISLTEQRARMFDLAGKEIFNTKVSTGRKGFATRTGDFVITDKYRTWTSTIYHASMPYFQRLSCGDFGLHQGYAPGYPASHGCIRVPADKASQLFSMTRVGDRVQIVP